MLGKRQRTFALTQTPRLGITTNLYVVAAVVVSVLLQVGIIALPFVRRLFEATTHTPMEWVLLLALALTPVTVIELVKLGRQFFGGSNPSDGRIRDLSGIYVSESDLFEDP
jgi:magnesium-transporting ATPase (P-type)